MPISKVINTNMYYKKLVFALAQEMRFLCRQPPVRSNHSLHGHKVPPTQTEIFLRPDPSENKNMPISRMNELFWQVFTQKVGGGIFFCIKRKEQKSMSRSEISLQVFNIY